MNKSIFSITLLFVAISLTAMEHHYQPLNQIGNKGDVCIEMEQPPPYQMSLQERRENQKTPAEIFVHFNNQDVLKLFEETQKYGGYEKWAGQPQIIEHPLWEKKDEQSIALVKKIEKLLEDHEATDAHVYHYTGDDGMHDRLTLVDEAMDLDLIMRNQDIESQDPLRGVKLTLKNRDAFNELQKKLNTNRYVYNTDSYDRHERTRLVANMLRIQAEANKEKEYKQSLTNTRIKVGIFSTMAGMVAAATIFLLAQLSVAHAS